MTTVGLRFNSLVGCIKQNSGYSYRVAYMVGKYSQIATLSLLLVT